MYNLNKTKNITTRNINFKSVYAVFGTKNEVEKFDKDIEEVKKIAKGTKVQPWTKEVVFKVYCNDNLYELPLNVLEQMRDHLNNIIDSKTPLE